MLGQGGALQEFLRPIKLIYRCQEAPGGEFFFPKITPKSKIFARKEKKFQQVLARQTGTTGGSTFLYDLARFSTIWRDS